MHVYGGSQYRMKNCDHWHSDSTGGFVCLEEEYRDRTERGHENVVRREQGQSQLEARPQQVRVATKRPRVATTTSGL